MMKRDALSFWYGFELLIIFIMIQIEVTIILNFDFSCALYAKRREPTLNVTDVQMCIMLCAAFKVAPCL